MSKDSFDRGLTKRRQVMGDDFVDRALGQADELTMPMQDFVTRWPGTKFGIERCCPIVIARW